MRSPWRTVRHFLVLEAAMLLAASAAHGGDDTIGSRSLQLDFLSGTVGGSGGLDLRTDAPSSLALLLVGQTVQAVDLDGGGPLPTTLVNPSGLSVFPLFTDPTGRVRAIVSLPNNPALQGVTLFGQVLAATPSGLIETSALDATTFVPGAPGPSFADQSGAVPSTPATTPSGAGLARDFDGDGDPDLVLVTGAGSTAHVFRNDGAFSFQDVTLGAIPGGSTLEASGVLAFDADGDGREDLLVFGGEGDPNAPPLPDVLYLNAGSFQFVVSTGFPTVAGRPRDAVAADVDGDGDLDVVLANGNDGTHGSEVPQPNLLLRNQGFLQGGTEGVFVSDVSFENAAWNGPNFNTGVAVGDIDDDGDLDIFFARSDTQASDGVPGQPNVLLRNDGGVFTDVTAAQLLPAFSDNSEDARFADLDQDGHLDLILAQSVLSVPSASAGEYYRNQGGGTFVEDPIAFPQIDESELAIRLGVHVVDVDLDGDPDVLMNVHEFFDFDGSTGNPGGTGGDDLLFLNQGGAQGGVLGTFLLDPSFTVGGVFISADHVPADFDLDGDVDIYVTNLGQLLGGPDVTDRIVENRRIP